jgi:DNA modification methylase
MGLAQAFLRSLLSLPSTYLYLDPFCGSATTGIVTLRHGHRLIGIEKEAWAFHKIKKRLDHFKA